MADNITLPGVGVVFRSKDVSGVQTPFLVWIDGATPREDLATYPLPVDAVFPGARDAGLSSSYVRALSQPGASTRFVPGNTTEVLLANPGTDAPICITGIMLNTGHVGDVTFRNAASTGSGSGTIRLLRATESAQCAVIFSAGCTVEAANASCDMTISWFPLGAG